MRRHVNVGFSKPEWFVPPASLSSVTAGKEMAAAL